MLVLLFGVGRTGPSGAVFELSRILGIRRQTTRVVGGLGLWLDNINIVVESMCVMRANIRVTIHINIHLAVKTRLRSRCTCVLIIILT